MRSLGRSACGLAAYAERWTPIKHMNKNQAITLVNKRKGGAALTNKNTHWANLSIYGSKEGWWINVPFDKCLEELHFILDNERSGQFLVVHIPRRCN